MINVLSLFDGISCARVALERAGIPIRRYYASEIDKHAITVAHKNYPDTVQMGTVTALKAKHFPKIDLLVGGSPCQAFSMAGKQLNFEDPRGKLFFEYVRIYRELRERNPDIKFLLENVRMKKEYQDVITDFMGVEPILIDSALVSGQSRKRLYWSNIEGVTQPEDRGIMFQDVIGGFPCRIVGRRLNEDGVRVDHDKNTPAIQRVEVRTDGKSNRLTTVEKDSRIVDLPIIYDPQHGGRSYIGKCPTLTVGKGGGGHPKYIVQLKEGQEGMPLEVQESMLSLVFQFPHGQSKGGVRALDKSPSVTAQYHNNYFPFDVDALKLSEKALEYMDREVKGGRNHWDFKHHSDIRNPKSAAVVANFFKGVPYNVLRDWNCIRKMHPIECERLQTLPDNYSAGIPDTHRYHCIGNGWTVDVIAHILSFYKS